MAVASGLTPQAEDLSGLLRTLRLVRSQFPHLIALLRNESSGLVCSEDLRCLSFEGLAVRRERFVRPSFHDFLDRPLCALRRLNEYGNGVSVPLPYAFLERVLLSFVGATLTKNYYRLYAMREPFPVRRRGLVAALRSRRSRHVNDLLYKRFRLIYHVQRVRVSGLFRSLSVVCRR